MKENNEIKIEKEWLDLVGKLPIEYRGHAMLSIIHYFTTGEMPPADVTDPMKMAAYGIVSLVSSKNTQGNNAPADKVAANTKSGGNDEKEWSWPTEREVKIFWDIKGLSGDPLEFFDYYKDHGWSPKNNHFVTWQALAYAWSKKAKYLRRPHRCVAVRGDDGEIVIIHGVLSEFTLEDIEKYIAEVSAIWESFSENKKMFLSNHLKSDFKRRNADNEECKGNISNFVKENYNAKEEYIRSIVRLDVNCDEYDALIKKYSAEESAES